MYFLIELIILDEYIVLHKLSVESELSKCFGHKAAFQAPVLSGLRWSLYCVCRWHADRPSMCQALPNSLLSPRSA